MSSAICFNLDQSKILPSHGNDLNETKTVAQLNKVIPAFFSPCSQNNLKTSQDFKSKRLFGQKEVIFERLAICPIL